MSLCFFFQAEDGIRDLVRSRGLGDVYKRQGEDLDQTAGIDVGGGIVHGVVIITTRPGNASSVMCCPDESLPSGRVAAAAIAGADSERLRSHRERLLRQRIHRRLRPQETLSLIHILSLRPAAQWSIRGAPFN